MMSVILIKAPPDDEVSAMMPLVTHSSPDETEALVDGVPNSDEDEEEDLELDHPGQGQARIVPRSSTRVSQAELLENLKPGQIVRTNDFWILWATFFLNTQVCITYAICIKILLSAHKAINANHIQLLTNIISDIYNI